MYREWLERLRKLVGDPAAVDSVDYPYEPSLQERRRQYRLAVHLEAVLKVDGQTLPVSVVDLHHDGARVLAPRWVRPGTPGRLIDKSTRIGRPRLECEVSWAHTTPDQPVLLGLRFDKPVSNSWIQEVLRRLGYPNPGAFATRRTRRVEARIPFELQDSRCFPLGWGATLDLGLGGALLKLPFELKLKEVVRLVLVTSEVTRPLTLLAQVVASRRLAVGNHLQNLRFFNLLALQRHRLEEVLIQHLRLVERPLWVPGGDEEPSPPRRSRRRAAYPEWLALPE